MQTFVYQTQKLDYNHNTKTAYTIIEDLFYSAGKKLGWSEKAPGIGLNLNIVSFVLKTKCTLVVHVRSTGNSYFIQEDKLKDFLMKNNCEYVKSGVELRVISFKKFIRCVDHLEENK